MAHGHHADGQFVTSPIKHIRYYIMPWNIDAHPFVVVLCSGSL